MGMESSYLFEECFGLYCVVLLSVFNSFLDTDQGGCVPGIDEFGFRNSVLHRSLQSLHFLRIVLHISNLPPIQLDRRRLLELLLSLPEVLTQHILRLFELNRSLAFTAQGATAAFSHGELLGVDQRLIQTLPSFNVIGIHLFFNEFRMILKLLFEYKAWL